ncbi:D-amino-acid dehydrogenase [Devosia enhydra]|uniref:D-amino acid dehydrogenase n=1 Tax=Devosia enhydra TaxID=665118 RepID=A0A1K2I3F2_9HYPH|nr:D-amino acid dehydrogenase [Devosia enhydra]SFZ86284.1 D-amino-acid dehydrogenase [Devosia enhydra]
MNILILGSGVVGVTSAWYLAQAGHAVTVIDRQPGPGLETSFANAGEVSFGYASPWAGPGIPLKALRWLTMEDGPLLIRPRLDPAMMRWGLQLLANCTHAAYERNKGRMVRLAEYSRLNLRDLRSQTGIAYDQRMQGTVQLFRTQKQLDHAEEDIAVLREAGVPFEVLDPRGAIAAEPGLATARAPFVGALRLPNDETGDCKMFTERLADLCAEDGVSFRYNETILGLEQSGGAVTGVRTDRGLTTADIVIVALGSHSPGLVRPLGIDLPVYPVKGYSLTVPIINADVAPVSTVMDETYKVATTRLGDRIRVGGTAELAGYDLTLDPKRRGPLDRSLRDLFPEAGDLSRASFWCGLRPMTPDGTPVIGPTSVRGLYLNTGHGTLGWTLSAGSGKLIADLISGKTPEIEHQDFAISRY